MCSLTSNSLTTEKTLNRQKKKKLFHQINGTTFTRFIDICILQFFIRVKKKNPFSLFFKYQVWKDCLGKRCQRILKRKHSFRYSFCESTFSRYSPLVRQRRQLVIRM